MHSVSRRRFTIEGLCCGHETVSINSKLSLRIRVTIDRKPVHKNIRSDLQIDRSTENYEVIMEAEDYISVAVGFELLYTMQLLLQPHLNFLGTTI
jgi:hypothetical protein